MRQYRIIANGILNYKIKCGSYIARVLESVFSWELFSNRRKAMEK